MTDNPFLDAALDYAKRGWPVFPCCPRSKIPATPHGFKDATTDEKLIRAWWALEPDYNVAIATGHASGVYVLDIDDKPGRSVDEALASLGLGWPETPTVRTGGGGVQLFYAFPTGSDLSITGGKLGLGIDTRGNGGYVVAPPSIHPNGNPYKWMDCEDAALAPTPAEIIKRLETQKTKSFLSAGEKLTGGRHQTLMTAAALMRGIGMIPREIGAALSEMVARLDLSDGRVVTDKEVRDIAAWTADKDMGTLNIEAVVHGEAVAASLTRGMGEALAEVLDESSTRDPGPFPAHLLEVPGFIGKLAAYTNEQSNRRQPLFALAGAISALSVLTGRKVETESGARTNCYCVVVAPSGSGKEVARSTNKSLFAAAGCAELLGAEDFASDSGIVSAVEQQPAVLFQIDEIGHVLKAVNDPRAPAHLAGINAVLMRLYTSASGPFKGKAYRDAKSTPIINQPHAVLYGTTTPERFWSSISRSAIDDGLLGRCLIFTGVMTRLKRVVRKPLPADLVAEATWWHKQSTGGNLSGINPQPRLVPYDESGDTAIEALCEEAEDRCQSEAGKPTGALWARAVQRVDQLALLYACSRDREKPVIDAAAVAWARGVILYLTDWIAWATDRHVSETESESVTKRVLRLIEAAGEEGVTQRDLTRLTQWMKGRSRERRDVLTELVDGGAVFSGTRAPSGGRTGRPATVYVHSRFVPTEIRQNGIPS